MTGRLVNPIVHVVDPDQRVADQLSRQFHSLDLESCVYEDALTFLEAFDARASPQCIVTEIHLPRLVSGAELLRRVLSDRLSPTTPVIFHTTSSDISAAVELMKAGAFDVIPKVPSTEPLSAVVQQALRYSLELAEAAEERAAKESVWSTLSSHEQKIVRLIVDGRSSQQIAQDLNRSKKTIDAHRGRIMRKLGVRGVAELVRAYMEGGYKYPL